MPEKQPRVYTNITVSAPHADDTPHVKWSEIDPLRAYNDKELCAILGGISRTTLWTIRDVKGLLKSSRLYPGGPRRTTPQQILDYIAYLNEAEKIREKEKSLPRASVV